MSTKTSGSTEVLAHLKINDKLSKVCDCEITPFLSINPQFRYFFQRENVAKVYFELLKM